MSDDLPLVVVGRRRGRPRAAIPKGTLTAHVPLAYHDRLARLAIKHGVSVSEVLSRVLQKTFDMPGISLQNK